MYEKCCINKVALPQFNIILCQRAELFYGDIKDTNLWVIFKHYYGKYTVYISKHVLESGHVPMCVYERKI